MSVTGSASRRKSHGFVVGVDLSLTATGVARIVEGKPQCFTVTSKPTKNATTAQVNARLRGIVTEVELLCLGYGWREDAPPPDVVCVEGPSFGSQGAGTWDRAGLWHLTVDRLIARGWPVVVLAPKTVKAFAAGKGNADKTAVAVGMSKLWPDVVAANDNEWDALTLATAGAQWLGLDVPVRAHHAKALEKVQWPTGGTGSVAA